MKIYFQQKSFDQSSILENFSRKNKTSGSIISFIGKVRELRDKQKIYWSHCGTSRARDYEILGVDPLNSRQDVINLGKFFYQIGTGRRCVDPSQICFRTSQTEMMLSF